MKNRIYTIKKVIKKNRDSYLIFFKTQNKFIWWLWWKNDYFGSNCNFIYYDSFNNAIDAIKTYEKLSRSNYVISYED